MHRETTATMRNKGGALILSRFRIIAIEECFETMMTRIVSNLTLLQKNNNISHLKPATIARNNGRNQRKKPKLFITIPELLPGFPSSPRHNLPGDDALAENIQWVMSFGFQIHTSYPRVYGKKYALIMPKVKKEHCVLLLNLMAVLAISDGLIDDMCASDVENVRDMMGDILRNPDKKRSKRDGRLGQLFQSFCQCVFTAGTLLFRRRFTEDWSEHMDSILQKAQDRAYTHYRDVESYMELRRSTVGARPLYKLLFLKKDYPLQMLEDPKVMELEHLALDMNALSQDICSYNQQQASNTDAHNIIGVYQHETSCSIQEAFDYAARRCADASHQFVAALNDLPPHLEPLAWYFDELGAMAVGNHNWSFIAPEHRLGADVLKTRIFEVLPREK